MTWWDKHSRSVFAGTLAVMLVAGVFAYIDNRANENTTRIAQLEREQALRDEIVLSGARGQYVNCVEIQGVRFADDYQTKKETDETVSLIGRVFRGFDEAEARTLIREQNMKALREFRRRRAACQDRPLVHQTIERYGRELFFSTIGGTP